MANKLTISALETLNNVNIGNDYEYQVAEIAGTLKGGRIDVGGSAKVISGGTAEALSVSGPAEADADPVGNPSGVLEVKPGGTGKNISLEDNAEYVVNGVSSGTSVHGSGALEIIEAGGADTNVSITRGMVRVMKDGRISQVSLESGVLTLRNGALGESITVIGGRVDVSNAQISDLMLMSTGTLQVLSGSVALRGEVGLEGTVTFVTKASVSYSIVGQNESNSTPFINDWSKLSGASMYTLVISDTQNPGIYRIAANSTYPESLQISTEGAGDTSVCEGNWYGFTRTCTIGMEDDVLLLYVMDEDLHPGLNASGTVFHWTDKESENDYELILESEDSIWTFTSSAKEAELINLPQGTYSCQADEMKGNAIVKETQADTIKKLVANTDGRDDLFFASANGVWDKNYNVRNLGSADGWKGTRETVSLAGKNKISLVFEGSEDTSRLFLTDSTNGDALILDDIYSQLPEDCDARQRLAKINEIFAGGGEDIIDLTSQIGDVQVSNMIVHGGLSDDVIWAGAGGAILFGDDGNDRLVGNAYDDILIGGIDDDSLHGGGGNDTFCFGEGWGCDTVEQTQDGKVTLWFQEGIVLDFETSEDKKTICDDQGNSVTLLGNLTKDDVVICIGETQLTHEDWGMPRYSYTELTDIGAFA